jgi:hypothetical protein
MSICFLKQKVVGFRLVLRASTRPSKSPYCSGATPRVRLVTPSFSDIASTYQNHASATSPLDFPFGQTFLEGVLVLPNSGQVGGSSSNDNVFSSLQAPGPALQKLDVRLRTHPGGFSSFYPRAPYATSPAPYLRFALT